MPHIQQSSASSIPWIHLVVLQAVLQGRDSSVGSGSQSRQACYRSRLGSCVLGALQLAGPHPVRLQKADGGQGLQLGVHLHPLHWGAVCSCTHTHTTCQEADGGQGLQLGVYLHPLYWGPVCSCTHTRIHNGPIST